MTSKADGPLDRAFAVVGHVAEQTKAVSVAEIASALALPLPTTHRLVGNLEARGLLQKAIGTKRYVVGNQMVTLAAKAIAAAFRTARRHAVLRAVADEIGEQCEIGVVRGDVVSYVDSVSVIQPLGLQFRPGEAAPLHCTSTGKIYMSRLPARYRDRLVDALTLTKFTDNTITDRDTFLTVLEETRRRGWAKSNEEYVRGVVGCSVPIVSPDGNLIACLGVSVPVARVSFDELDRFIAPLQKAARLLSQTILADNESEASEEAR
ncbi:IclR family transcriptional regulator [Bradyrhizobium jicamae]|uniref:IclR family transcriptional regulator n=1 Tax=Bradyrhizobium jicamae TaxID=280332 RepID=A0ABS5FK81_9BRAD|nr:IclR family transcriptional regulator [Bradyrhizobium jicamae]MBR0797190.1 IclR family transcriptional regulator [Bradyrhizobium jicamae]MBR0934896.1 IclR family transcriptional regulator [Bradyrhizobium jicamae]